MSYAVDPEPSARRGVATAWPAGERFGIAAAPSGLALVQDVLNTRPSPRKGFVDLLSTVGSAQRWAAAAMAEWAEAEGHRRRRVQLRTADVDELRQLREQLAALVRTEDEPVLPALSGLTLTAGTTTDGRLDLEPTGSGWQLVGGAVLLEIHRAGRLDEWRRLKTCRSSACPIAFYDRSRNNSRVWHDVTVCGNIANLRASRARRRRVV
ncbi:CGNR zinc finger domain-containing protein [Amycolatopsis sp. DSM 110486]|uniref:CGNR zinc finger domain-containing protein n=1 Tax=Amycolatopsis sp. DSM 110486 TaxID=2865832 RepID=UPI0021055D51|nr:CGNR zinc finger domain-containing protein [Amycolatopsis sp. DSM 110486]